MSQSVIKNWLTDSNIQMTNIGPTLFRYLVTNSNGILIDIDMEKMLTTLAYLAVNIFY